MESSKSHVSPAKAIRTRIAAPSYTAATTPALSATLDRLREKCDECDGLRAEQSRTQSQRDALHDQCADLRRRMTGLGTVAHSRPPSGPPK